jgi:hypothetical protein
MLAALGLFAVLDANSKLLSGWLPSGAGIGGPASW